MSTRGPTYSCMRCGSPGLKYDGICAKCDEEIQYQIYLDAQAITNEEGIED